MLEVVNKLSDVVSLVVEVGVGELSNVLALLVPSLVEMVEELLVVLELVVLLDGLLSDFVHSVHIVDVVVDELP